jgi:four helix bundle protein
MNETISRFEDLIAWKKARILTRKIYSVSTVGKFGKDFGLRNQIQRAAVSIMSNIAEGYERGAYGEFHHFVSIAKASCAEVRCQL